MELSPAQMTEDQKIALSKIQKWLKTPEPFFVLSGYSGTGKTTLIGALSKKMSTRDTIWTAPTNKATKVLKGVVGHHMCKTIYSALNLRMEEHEDILKLSEFSSADGLENIKYIIVDESSMISNEVFKRINVFVKRHKFKVLFIADLAQLPPVTEDISPVSQLKCSKASLTKVVRHDNQILEVATYIRSFIDTPLEIERIEFSHTDENSSSVWALNRDLFVKEIIAKAETGFEDCKVIAWRNSRVDMYNQSIRKYLFKDTHVKPWVVGERIMFAEPILDQFVTVDDEATIEEVLTGNYKYKEFEIRCYFIRVKMLSGSSVNFKIVHESSVGQYKAALDKLAMAAREPGMKWKWKTFWAFKAEFQKIRYAYAITSHRAQGSTFSDVFVDTTDILANSNRNEAKKCLYVACSRASKRLFLKV